MKQFSPKEDKIRDEIRSVYNSGRCARALEMATDFLKEFPDSLQAKYTYAVMSGDYSYEAKHSDAEKEELLKIAKAGIEELFKHPDLSQYPQRFQKSVKNEYYWFHEFPEEQYKLGINDLTIEARGAHYSACVGASMLALKMLKQGSRLVAEEWANKSWHHFQEFEKLAPDWHNINYFAAQAQACLGNYDFAKVVYLDTFRKQKGDIKKDEVTKFDSHIESIKLLRKK